MKVKTLILSAATAVIIPAVGFAGLAMADSPGQIESGNIYKIQNITQKTDFANPATANACDELEYSVQLHNPDYDTISNVVANATLPSGASTSNTSKMTVTYSGGVNSSVSATATLNLASAQSVSYVSGSTELLNVNGQLIKTLPNGVIGSGVNIGNLAGSTTEYVNFEAKVNCPSTPTPVTPSTPSTPSTTPSAPAPTALVNTGPGSVIGIFVAATLAGIAAYRWILSRRLSRQ